jgi:hypothetical protein
MAEHLDEVIEIFGRALDWSAGRRRQKRSAR